MGFRRPTIRQSTIQRPPEAYRNETRFLGWFGADKSGFELPLIEKVLEGPVTFSGGPDSRRRAHGTNEGLLASSAASWCDPDASALSFEANEPPAERAIDAERRARSASSSTRSAQSCNIARR
jgi:hypothetical protein